MSSFVFDIETAPLSDDALKEVANKTFVLPKHPGEFDESAVKLGQLKDPAKIQKKIDDARDAHTKAIMEYDDRVELAEVEHFESVKSKAALSPTTGQVLAIGIRYSSEDRVTILPTQDSSAESREKAILQTFWQVVDIALSSADRVIGWNSNGFDMPFLLKRSWIQGVTVPPTVIKGRFWPDNFVDLMQIWCKGSNDRYAKLDDVAKLLGLAGKLDGVDGGMFAGLWESDRKKAIEYLESDVNATMDIAERLYVM